MDSLVDNKRVLAVIPARGGSKRIPKKNILNFNGKPMIAWTIESAIKSEIFTDIIVSTDDKEIAEISKLFGAKIHNRKKFTDDYATVSDVVCNVINELKVNYDIVVMLMPNCPIRNEIDIKNAMINFIEKKHFFQISCFKYGWMNPWWAHTINNKQQAKAVFETPKNRSQDLEELYCPSGAIWIAQKKELVLEKTFYGNNYAMYPISWKNAVDIDEYDDLDLANLIFKMFN